MTTTDPHRLVDLFIKDRTSEKSQSTIYNNQTHLDEFLGWCHQNDIESVRNLDGEHFLEYKFYLRQSIKDSTIRIHFSTLRTFFRFCESIDATRQDQRLSEKLQTPDFDKGDLTRDDMMDFEEVENLLNYLAKFEYATARHTLFVIFWHTGCRRGALRGLDLDDYKPVRKREHGHYGLLQFKHRPDTDTPLKNKERGQREVMVWPEYGEIIEDYIEMNRRDVTDEYGRKPLVTSPQGRYSKSAIQGIMYAITRPCYYSAECPHGRSIEDCEATYFEAAPTCPDSLSPHPMRRTSITYHLEEKDWTYEAASGRFDVSGDVLRNHYDESSEEGQRRTRAAHFFDGDQSTL